MFVKALNSIKVYVGSGGYLYEKHKMLTLIILLFFIVLAVWGVAFLFINKISLYPRNFVYLGVYLLLMGIVLVLVVRGKESFHEYGFRWPRSLMNCMVLSALLASVYVIITVFIPGSLRNFEVLPPNPFDVYTNITIIFVAVFAEEIIFRGYILRNLIKMHGFFTAILLGSAMYSLTYAIYRLPLALVLEMQGQLESALSFFMAGIFLGTLFYKTRTLMYCIVVHLFIRIFQFLTPLHAMINGYERLLFEIIAYATLTYVVLITVLTRKDGE